MLTLSLEKKLAKVIQSLKTDYTKATASVQKNMDRITDKISSLQAKADKNSMKKPSAAIKRRSKVLQKTIETLHKALTEQQRDLAACEKSYRQTMGKTETAVPTTMKAGKKGGRKKTAKTAKMDRPAMSNESKSVMDMPVESEMEEMEEVV